MSKPSYLYGTWHVSEKLAFNLSDTFYIALSNSDMIAMELNPDIWLNEIKAMEDAQTDMEYLNTWRRPVNFYKRGFSLNIPDRKDLGHYLRSSPDVVNSMLYRTNKSKDDYEEDTYLDLYIFQAGKKLNKPVFGLEDFKQSREMVRKSEQCEEDFQDKEKRELFRLKLKELEGDKSYSETFENAYGKGDLDLLDSLYTLTGTKPCTRRYMLNERNIIMANRMDSIMQHHSLFTGVGAAHLPGNDGVIELLRKKGYSLRPVKATDGFNNKMVRKLEELRYPLQFSMHYTADSALGAMLPGALTELTSSGASKTYLFNDVSNGTYYYIQRVNYSGGMNGESQEHMMSRVDSVLFENIPGKILSRKTIHHDGLPGFDIVNKTRRGDIQRQQIFFSPDEICFIKMSGTGNYVEKGKEADLFFNSLTFKQNLSGADKVFRPASGDYEIRIPASAPVYVNRGPYAIQREIVSCRQQDKKASYLLIASSLYDLNYLEEDTFELNFMAETFARQLNYKILSSKPAHVSHYPALDFILQNDSSERIYSRIIIRAQNYYLLSAKTSDTTLAYPYLSSFQFTPPRPLPGYSVFNDTLLHFTVRTHLSTSPYRDLARPVQHNYNDSYYGSGDDKKPVKEEKDYQPLENSRIYLSGISGEKIYTEFHKFSMYYEYPTLDKFWEVQERNHGESRTFRVSRIQKEEQKGLHILNFLLSDTNSSRGIQVKMIQKCGILYTLKALIDTVDGPSAYVRNFYESFTPQDTCIGLDVTTDKLSTYFFSKIYSADTLERKRAENAISYVKGNLNKEHASELMAAIDNPRFALLKQTDKTELVTALGTLPGKDIPVYLENLYKRYTDSLKMQLLILKALAGQKTALAAKTFLHLLQEDMPVSKNSNDIWELFTPWTDSLALAAGMFPGLLEYAKFPEFKYPVYSLLNSCVEKGYIRKKQYASFKHEILSDARYNFRIYLSSDKKESRHSSDYGGSYLTGLGNSEPSNVMSYEQECIYWYVNLLQPWYSKDAGVKKFIDRTLHDSPNVMHVFIAATLAKHDVTVPDSVWKALASDQVTRYWLYRAMRKDKRMDKFDTVTYKQKALVISMLFGDDYDEKNDTLVLLEKVSASTGRNKGFVYIFKSRPLDKKIWKMSYIGIMPDNTLRVNIRPEVFRRNISYDGVKQLQKEREKIMRKLRIEGRRRASLTDFEGKRSSDSFYGDYYED
ncbi:MAG: TraB/GumN family protein [Bacteroidia bacterium]